MKLQDSRKRELPISGVNTNRSLDLGALFDGHIAREFADFDVDATMETMVAEPYVHCVATLAGGFGGREVRRFYGEHFVNQIPKDAKVTPISRTIGEDQVVDEFIQDLYAAFGRRDIAALAALVAKDVTKARAASSISFKNPVVALKSRAPSTGAPNHGT